MAPKRSAIASLIRRDGGEDLCAQSLCELYGYVSDAAGAGVYQHLLAAVYLGAIDDAFPCGDGDERERSGFPHGERLRFEREQIGIRYDIFGERSLQAPDAADHAVDLIARTKRGDAGADFLDGARHVETQYCGQRLVGVACLPGTDLGIERIDAACVDTHEHLTSPWLRAGKIGFGEWPPGMLNDVSFQDGSPLAQCSLLTRGPFPVADFGHVFAVLGDVEFVLLHHLGVALSEFGEAILEARDVLYSVEREGVAVETVEHGHVEGRGGGAFLLVAVDVKAIVVVALVGELVNDVGVAVEGEDDGLVDGEEAVEGLVFDAVGMLVEGFEREEIDDIDDADAQIGRPVAQHGDGGHGFKRGDVSGAGHDDFRIVAEFEAQVQVADAGDAVLRRRRQY